MHKLKLLFISIMALLFSAHSMSNVVHKERSLYRNLLVEETGDLRCLKFDEKTRQSSQSCMYISDPKKLVFNYTKLAFSSLLLIDNPKNVLIIGLGGGTLSI